MCNSIIRYARPQKARSATGEWKFIVNTGGNIEITLLAEFLNCFFISIINRTYANIEIGEM